MCYEVNKAGKVELGTRYNFSLSKDLKKKGTNQIEIWVKRVADT